MSLRASGTNCPKDDDAELRWPSGRGIRLCLVIATPAGRSGARLCLAIAALLLVCTLMAGAVSAGNWTDAGNFNTSWYDTYASGNTFYIYDAKSLAAFSEKVSINTNPYNFSGKTVKLMADIDLGDHNWTAIGTTSNTFKGTFDGDNHTISNVNIYAPDKDDQGFFGRTTEPAVLKNINIQNTNVVGKSQVGALAGSAYTGLSIENCHVLGSIKIQGNYKVGGLAGEAAYVATIQNCSVIGDQKSYVNGLYEESALEGDNVGGLIGYRAERYATLSECHTDIAVSGTRKVGGLIGALQRGNQVSDCSACGDVKLVYVPNYNEMLSAGALVGDVHPEVQGEQYTKIFRSTASGSISIPSAAVSTGANVSIGLIGAVRSSTFGYNNQNDLTTPEKNVTDCTYKISSEELQKLVKTGYMNTAGIGTVTVDDSATPSYLLIPGTNVTGVTWTGSENNGWILTMNNLASGAEGAEKTYRIAQSFPLQSGNSERRLHYDRRRL